MNFAFARKKSNCLSALKRQNLASEREIQSLAIALPAKTIRSFSGTYKLIN
jgi:hypothetical protein